MKKNLLFLLFWVSGLGAVIGQSTQISSAQSGWVSLKKAPPVAPLIAWQAPRPTEVTQKTPTYRVTVCIQSTESMTYQFFQNGKVLHGQQRGFKRVSCGQEVSEQLQLVPGVNKIYVTATNVAGTTTSESRLISYQPEEVLLGASQPLMQKRLALIVANEKYPKSQLKNPVNDGRAVKAQLEDLGFLVTFKENLTLRELTQTINTFMTDLDDKNVGLVYYAGHGLMIDGENFLQPVDADPPAESEVQWECYHLSRLIARMEEVNPNGANLVFWDACRINPYRSWRRGAGEKVYASMQPAVGTMIFYATEKGKPAYDGNEKNSYFTSELIKHINQPNVEIRELVDRIEKGLEQRGIKQPPYIEGRLRGKFFFKLAQ
ncbi:MAG: caspase family protein [Cytophagaceae bacterium]|nr:caspase family protein [Cytophagaceae bacterium]